MRGAGTIASPAVMSAIRITPSKHLARLGSISSRCSASASEEISLSLESARRDEFDQAREERPSVGGRRRCPPCRRATARACAAVAVGDVARRSCRGEVGIARARRVWGRRLPEGGPASPLEDAAGAQYPLVDPEARPSVTTVPLHGLCHGKRTHSCNDPDGLSARARRPAQAHIAHRGPRQKSGHRERVRRGEHRQRHPGRGARASRSSSSTTAASAAASARTCARRCRTWRRRGAPAIDFERVVIETTGLADPGPVAQTFFMDDEIAETYLLDSVLTLVDAKHGSSSTRARRRGPGRLRRPDLHQQERTRRRGALEDPDTSAQAHEPRAPQRTVHFGEVPIAAVFDPKGFNLNVSSTSTPSSSTPTRTIAMITTTITASTATTRTITTTTTT